MSVTTAPSDESVATLRLDGKRVRIELNDPLQRDAVIEELGYFEVAPLKMLGLPKLPLRESPNQLTRVSEMTISQLKRVVHAVDADASPAMDPQVLAYMRNRILSEASWATRNPDKYRVITLIGAMGERNWPTLLAKFREHDRRPVSMQTIKGFQVAAVEQASQKAGA